MFWKTETWLGCKLSNNFNCTKVWCVAVMSHMISPLVSVPKFIFLTSSVALGDVSLAETNQSRTYGRVTSSLGSFPSKVGLVEARVAPVSLNVLFSQGRIEV